MLSAVKLLNFSSWNMQSSLELLILQNLTSIILIWHPFKQAYTSLNSANEFTEII